MSPPRWSPRAYVWRLWNDVHSHRPLPSSPTFDGRVAGGLVLASLVLAVNYLFLNRQTLSRWLPVFLPASERDLWAYAAWGFGRFLTYGVLPMLYWRWSGQRVRDLNVRLPREAGAWKLVALLFVVFAPVLWAASTMPSFLAKYPLYKGAGHSLRHFLTWELAYASQFFGVELFYRGFLLELLRPVCGVYAVFISTIPYCMVHFGKPPLEVFGAIGAGILLGTLAMKERSIGPGLVLHLLVGVGMDLLALWHR